MVGDDEVTGRNLCKTTARADFATAMLDVHQVRLRFSSQTQPARYVLQRFLKKALKSSAPFCCSSFARACKLPLNLRGILKR
jgi:hypothetical protein